MRPGKKQEKETIFEKYRPNKHSLYTKYLLDILGRESTLLIMSLLQWTAVLC